MRPAPAERVPGTGTAEDARGTPLQADAAPAGQAPSAGHVASAGQAASVGHVASAGDAASVVSLRRAAAVIGGRTIWSDVSVEVGAAQFVAVLGPNGVGKSTLLKVLVGLVPVTAGVVHVLGERPGRRNARIGYLPQRRAFDPGTRIRGIDIVRLGLDGDRWGTPLPRWMRGRKGRAAGARIAEAIDLVGAGEYANRPIGQVSGGEQQRLLIAQALIRRPELLILDEPLDSLDVTNQAAVSALVQRVCRTQGVAVLMVAHDVNPILPFLDQVIYLAHGGAVMGRPEEVITAETLSMLYGTPIDVLHDRTGRLVVVGQPDAGAPHQATNLS
jgi:zinc/manganese transport system ATP-binding protein